VNPRQAFYRDAVSRWVPDRGASVLVVAGGKSDRDVFHELGFTNVVVTNLAPDPGEEVTPYAWARQDLAALTYGDGAFDYVVVHAGLHHCRSPHRGLCEMYRVARRGVLAIDPPDNLAVRVMQRLRLAQVYECVAVDDHEGRAGGVDGSGVPNHIYRWTEREIEKTIRSYAPAAVHRFRYAYGLDEPAGAFINPSPAKRAAISLLKPAYRLFTLIFPRQQNLFAFMVDKPVLPRDLHPWLTMAGEDVRFVRSGDPSRDR
jgi:SAM-dependent methyltransferase